MKQTFDEWWESSLEDGTFITDDSCLQEKYFAAKEAWEYRDVELQRVVTRLEEFPSCISCYLTIEEMVVGNSMKEDLIRILKEEVL